MATDEKRIRAVSPATVMDTISESEDKIARSEKITVSAIVRADFGLYIFFTLELEPARNTRC
jgi:hypothetical protein